MIMNSSEQQLSGTRRGSKINSRPGSVGRALRPAGPARPMNRIGRRDFLKGVGALGLAGAASPFVAAAASITRPRPSPIQHIIVDMQENRSFDHYYGYAPFVGSYGVPAGYSQPNGRGGSVKPHHAPFPDSSDPKH